MVPGNTYAGDTMGHTIITEVACPKCEAPIGRRCTGTGSNPTHALRVAAYQNLIQRAFFLVNPATYWQEMARRGLASQEAADRMDWKGEIARSVTSEAIDAAGLSVEWITNSIQYMTGTPARVLPVQIEGEPWLTYIRPRPGFLFMADGYRKGPMGP